MSREIDTIIETGVKPINGSCIGNFNSSKYSARYDNHSALINENTAKVNFGYIIKDTKVPTTDNHHYNHHSTFASLKNSQEIVLPENGAGGRGRGGEESQEMRTRDRIFSNTHRQLTSTICGTVTNAGRVIATSFTELPVGVTCDTRRARSEPGSLSMTVITSSRTSGGVNKQPTTSIVTTAAATASRIASLDRLDSLVTKRSEIVGTGQQSLFTTPVISGIDLSSKSKLPFSQPQAFNSSGENESDYVVDPAQGNAYYKGPFLGKGGFARVYLMTDIANGKRYACKIIPKNRMQKIHIQKIAREIMIHKGLNHINVVQMHHYFEDSLNVYMLLEACPRKSLMHVLKYRGKVTEPEARYYMKQMVTGVAYIHSQKVVHRDLKPGNMFLSEGMIVKIGDFGLATRPDGQRRRVTICGTPNYIAPEVLYKQAYSYEADVWALGCILYALLAGQPPFDTATLKETYSRICNNRYKKLGDNVISKNGQDLIKWLLQPIPELRPSLETVKEHPYLAMEFVPDRLAHSCCYRPPDITLTDTIKGKHDILLSPPTASFPSVTSLLSSTSCTSTVSRRRVVQPPQISGGSPKISMRQIETSPVTANEFNTKFMESGRPILNSSPKDISKETKVGNWLVRKFSKLVKLRRRFGNILCPDRKKSLENILMHHVLETCLSEIRNTTSNKNSLPISGVAPLFVTKWIDYSNKYGLCFQLSDRSVGVLFNDSTKMSYTRDRRRVEYTDSEDQVTRYTRVRDVPSSLQEKLELLRHFTEYMDDHLTNGGEISDNSLRSYPRHNGHVPRMRRWLRTDRAIVMELTVPLLQVNFFADHTKIVVSEGTSPKDYFVTYIDANRYTTTYRLSDLRESGCSTELYERLNYVCRASKEFAHLENNVACSEISINRKTARKS